MTAVYGECFWKWVFISGSKKSLLHEHIGKENTCYHRDLGTSTERESNVEQYLNNRSLS